MSTNKESKVFHSVGGVNTHVFLSLAGKSEKGATLYLGSALSLSYSVYREKTPVFNCGSHLIDGFSISNKYVAGSIISMMNSFDEFSVFMSSISKSNRDKDNSNEYVEYTNAVGIKEFHTYMKDDLVPFDIHVLFTNEYSGHIRKIVIYGATFINNGQVMSVDDLITENTLQYVARDLSEQHSLGEINYNIEHNNSISASSLLME